MNVLLNSLTEALRQGEMLLVALDDVHYAMKLPVAFNASIGGHYRHCLDHFQSLFAGLKTGVIDYDKRERDLRIETVRTFALERTLTLCNEAAKLDASLLDESIRVRSNVSYAADASPEAPSTIGREIMFCVLHAIHHYALIGVMGGILEIPLAEGFGIAPSTLKHHQETARLAA